MLLRGGSLKASYRSDHEREDCVSLSLTHLVHVTAMSLSQNLKRTINGRTVRIQNRR